MLGHLPYNTNDYNQIQWKFIKPGSVTPENSLPGQNLLGTDFFFINLTHLYGNSRSGTGNQKQGTKCALSIESRFKLFMKETIILYYSC